MNTPPVPVDSVRPVVLRPITEATNVEAYLLNVSAFPVPASELAPVASFIRTFMNAVISEWRLTLEVFIQYTQLHRGDGVVRFSRHARRWKPKLGLGVWPDREPPRYYTREDFEELMPGESLNPMMYKMFRVTAAEVRGNACETMLGSGTVLAATIPGDGAAFLSNGHQVLAGQIVPGSIPSFSFYVPLLEAKSLKGAQASQVEDWLCGSSVYIRESVEDQAILIAASRSVLPILKVMGASFSTGPDTSWRFPA